MCFTVTLKMSYNGVYVKVVRPMASHNKDVMKMCYTRFYKMRSMVMTFELGVTRVLLCRIKYSCE